MSNKNHQPVLSPSEIIAKRCRRVGSDDMKTAALKLRWAENEGYKGADLAVASALAQGFEVAIAMSERDDHEAAAKQAGNCLYTLKKNRDLTERQNRRSLGSIVIDCRDGHQRKIGEIVEWYLSVHVRIAAQIEEAKKAELAAAEAERLEIEAAEEEMLEFAHSVAAGHLEGSILAVKAA